MSLQLSSMTDMSVSPLISRYSNAAQNGSRCSSVSSKMPQSQQLLQESGSDWWAISMSRMSGPDRRLRNLSTISWAITSKSSAIHLAWWKSGSFPAWPPCAIHHFPRIAYGSLFNRRCYTTRLVTVSKSENNSVKLSPAFLSIPIT